MKMRFRYSPVCSRDKLDKSNNANGFFRNYYTYIILILSVLAVISLYIGGILTYLFEEDFTKFNYPLQVNDIRGLVEKIDNYEFEISTTPITSDNHINVQSRTLDYYSIQEILNSIHRKGDESWRIDPLTNFKDFEFTLNVDPTCKNYYGPVMDISLAPNSTTSEPISGTKPSVSVIIIVKSAVNNYARRSALRKSWYLNTTIDIFKFKTVFMVGRCHEHNPIPASTLELKDSWSPSDCESNIAAEAKKYGDIVQSSGIDSYYNNTIKTFMTLRWLSGFCQTDFSIAIDDDYVFELENFKKFMFDISYDYLPYAASKTEDQFQLNSDEKIIESTTSAKSRILINNKSSRTIALKRLSKQYLYAGYLMNYVHPLRSRLSKWYISRNEYSYDKYPPFITGGIIIMSAKTVRHLYYASYFTYPFKFDDVYVGILAYRLGIRPYHSDNLMCTLDDYMKQNPIRPNATSCIAVHDIEPAALISLWAERERSRRPSEGTGKEM